MSNVSSSDTEVPSGMDLSRSRGPYLFWVCVGVMILSTLAVALRFASRKLARQPLLFDDWTLLIALPCVLMPSILDIYCTKEVGFGKHVLALGPSPDTEIRDFWLHLWISNMLYPISTVLVKISILLFLHRTFRVGNFTIYASATGVVVFLWGFATVLTTIFSCHPIQGFWNRSVAHTCIKDSDYALGINIPNIVFDCVLLALPLGWLWGIRNSLSQKIALAAVFGLAGFVVAIGVLRLQSLLEYATSSDFTWDFVPIAILTALESNSALVCACLPTMSPILQFCLHGSFSPAPTKAVQPSRLDGRRRNLLPEHAEELAQYPDDKDSNHHRHRARLSSSSDRDLIHWASESKPGKEKKWEGIDEEMCFDDTECGLEPPKRIKQGWTTPKESRFSDW